MELLLTIALLSVYGMHTFLLYRFVLALCEIRKGVIVRLILAACCFLMAAIVIQPQDPVNIIGMLLVFGLCLFSLSDGNAVKKVSLVLILFPIIVSVNYLTEDTGRVFYYSLQEPSGLTDPFIHVLFYALRLPVWFLLCLFAGKKIAGRIRMITAGMWLIIDAVCLSAFIGIITNISFIQDKVTFTGYPSCVACIITSLGCLYLAVYISENIKNTMEIRQLRLQHSYYEQLSQNQQAIRRMRHDMNSQLSVVSSFLLDKEYGQALTHLEKLSGQMAAGGRNFCKNSVVNAVINAKYNLAVQNDIDCFINIDLGNLLSIDSVSLCSIFANTLDNAVEAAARIEPPGERKISLKARVQSGFFSFEITNTKANDVHVNNGKYITGKEDGESHGIGLEAVRDIVEQYEGTMKVSYTDKEFSILILIGFRSLL